LAHKIGFKSGQKWDEEGEKGGDGNKGCEIVVRLFHIVLYVPVSHINIFLPFPHKEKDFFKL